MSDAAAAAHIQIPVHGGAYRKISPHNKKMTNAAEKLRRYVDRRRLYPNLFLYIKLKHHLRWRGEDAAAAAPFISEDLLARFTDARAREKLTFAHMAGVGEEGVDNIALPRDMIFHYFLFNRTGCCEENARVPRKTDLYFSLLTYIYFCQFFRDRAAEKHEALIAAVKAHLDDPALVAALAESTFYNFRYIPDHSALFPYKFARVPVVHTLKFYEHYNPHAPPPPPPTLGLTNFLVHHLVTIFRFYRQYVLSFFLTSALLYQHHPLEIVEQSLLDEDEDDDDEKLYRRMHP